MSAGKASFIELVAIVAFFSVGSAFAQLKFTDVTDSSGIRHQFEVYEGMFGGGAAVLDYNNDGFEDVYITSGMLDDVLYRNNGNGTFTNVISESGITTSEFVTQGVAAADVNRDGWVDVRNDHHPPRHNSGNSARRKSSLR